jgi:2-polyprenyl-3-methyl-5-hydroxy-6-metoxy-1,4-benzoquinol methylase
MMTVEKHDVRARWEAAHELPRFRPAYPHEQVVRWAFRELDRAAVLKAKVLDVGCGAGRHSLFLAGEGFDTYACDISLCRIARGPGSGTTQGIDGVDLSNSGARPCAISGREHGRSVVLRRDVLPDTR